MCIDVALERSEIQHMIVLQLSVCMTDVFPCCMPVCCHMGSKTKCCHVHVCRSIAADVAKKEVQRTVLGVVQPGDSIPVPYGWQRAGEGFVRHSCMYLATF